MSELEEKYKDEIKELLCIRLGHTQIIPLFLRGMCC